jgi:hypothetical protein
VNSFGSSSWQWQVAVAGGSGSRQLQKAVAGIKGQPICSSTSKGNEY